MISRLRTARPAFRLLLSAAIAAFAFSASAAEDAVQDLPPVLPDNACLDPGAAGTATRAAPPPRLVEGLGYAGLEPDSEDPQVRAWFAQGVRLVWAFDEVEAVRAFQEAQRLAPGCAMCFFGEAWARSPTINLQPRTEELPAARAAAQRAMALSRGLDARDRLLIRAMAIRTGHDDRFRQKRYAAFLERAARRHPQDDMLAILAADARMQVSESMEEGNSSQRRLERVLARNPGHGGAIHFYIHLTDWIDQPHLAVPHAERLAQIAPAASHLVHMPSHSFFGVGRYADAASANLAAIAADRAYEERVRPPASAYRTGLLAHNMHFAMNSALMRGDGATALQVADQFRDAYLTGEIDRRVRLLSSSTFYAEGLHGDRDSLIGRELPEPALERAFALYARGEALTRGGDSRGVAEQARRIALLRVGPDGVGLDPRGQALAEIFQKVLEGRAAMMEGRHSEAQTAYRTAMQRQIAANFGSDPPLFWYPVRRSLAAALFAAGDVEGARRQLRASLRRWPNDAPALYLLSRADAQIGDTQSAADHLQRARAGWAGDVDQIDLIRI